MRGWHTTFNKPIIITEYGADTVAGLHQVRAYDVTASIFIYFSGCTVWGSSFFVFCFRSFLIKVVKILQELAESKPKAYLKHQRETCLNKQQNYR